MFKSTLRLLPILIAAGLLSAQQIQVRVNSRISSETAKPGMAFQGVLLTPVQFEGNSCAKGSPVGGVVAKADRSGRLSSPGVLEIQPTWLSCHGHRVPVTAEPIRLEGRSHTKNNAVLIGGGAGLGAILGGIFGGGKGAAIGAAAGAGAGTVGAAATGRHEATIEPEAVVAWNVSPAPPPVQSASNHRPQAPQYHDSDHHTRHHDHDGDYDDDDRDDRDRTKYSDVRFTDHDRIYLSRCLVSNYRLPPGLAKQGKIPPGHARKMAQAGYTELPYPCTAELSPLPSGYRPAVGDTRVVLLDAAQRVIDSFIWQAEARGE
jgi:hypothetical protein